MNVSTSTSTSKTATYTVTYNDKPTEIDLSDHLSEMAAMCRVRGHQMDIIEDYYGVRTGFLICQRCGADAIDPSFTWRHGLYAKFRFWLQKKLRRAV